MNTLQRLALSSILLLAGSACAQNAAAPAKPATPPVAKAADAREMSLIDRYLRIRTPGSATLAPGGALYVRDWPDGVFQIYRYPGGVAKIGAPVEKLTSFADGASGYTLSQDGKRLLITAAVGGNENDQVYMLDPAAPPGTEPTPILTGPKVQHSINEWLHDDSGFIYTANDESPSDFYIYRYDFGTGKEGKKTKILGKEGSWSAQDVKRDASRYIVGRYYSISRSDIFELDPASGNMTDISIRPKGASADTKEGEGPTAANSVAGYMPGEESVLILSDAENGVRSLYLRDLKTGEVTKPISELEGKEIDGAGVNRERNLLVVVVNREGFGELHVYHLPTFAVVRLPEIEEGVVGGGSVRGRTLTWSMSNARTPGITYACEIEDATPPPGRTLKSTHSRPLTQADTQGIDLSEFPLPKLIKYKSFDGTEIPAFLFLPPGYPQAKDARKPIPFLVNYHGGPEGQHRPVFSASTQYFLAQGVGIIQPNVRGSTGYGREFHMKDDYKKRWDSVRDGVDAAKWLVDNGYSSPGMMATWGGSYGGFMSVACLVEDQERVNAGTQKQKLFGAGINMVGIVNMKTFLEQTSGYRRKLREAEYGPLSDPAFLESVSPIRKIDMLNVPMMIAHGLNDPRVPVGEAMQLAMGLQAKGLDPVLVFAPDEGHGFQKLSNRAIYMKRMDKFLKDTIAKPMP